MMSWACLPLLLWLRGHGCRWTVWSLLVRRWLLRAILGLLLWSIWLVNLRSIIWMIVLNRQWSGMGGLLVLNLMMLLLKLRLISAPLLRWRIAIGRGWWSSVLATLLPIATNWGRWSIVTSCMWRVLRVLKFTVAALATLVEATSAATACATTTGWLLPVRRLLVLLIASRGATLGIRRWWRWRWRRRVAVLV